MSETIKTQLKKKELKDQILKFFSHRQVTDSDRFVRSTEYKGYWLNDDDSPVYPYEHIVDEIQRPRENVKTLVIEMRNDGLVELIMACNEEGRPCGSGWSLTGKGLEYVVDNNLIEL